MLHEPSHLVNPRPGGVFTAPAVGFRHSLRFRLLALVCLFVVAATILLAFYTLRQFEQATTFEIEHEGRLMSDMLQATILPALARNDIAGVQAHVDRIGAIREKNDIEINVVLLRDGYSDIVASNVPGNIEKADPEEHANLLLALEQIGPIVSIEEPVADSAPPNEMITPSHPDYYIPSDRRVLTLSTPLVVDGRKLGCINVKSTLAAIDDQLDHSRRVILAAAALEVLMVLLGLGLLLNVKLFRPLLNLTENMQHIAAGDLERKLPAADSRDEIGVMAREFNHMARQLAQARTQLHKYLNPSAIDEAYRRATAPAAQPLAVERELSVLFVDIVAFTTTAEQLGPSRTVAYLNRFHDLIAAMLVNSGGYIDKFVADEVVCIFDVPEHARHAVQVARSILQTLRRPSEHGEIRVRIGVNSGPCIIADIGSEAHGRLDRTVIGDTVNVTQRLMAAAQPQTALIAAATFKALPSPPADLRYFGRLELKGKTQSVEAYELLPPA